MVTNNSSRGGACTSGVVECGSGADGAGMAWVRDCNNLGIVVHEKL